jgi:hypothetical protein
MFSHHDIIDSMNFNVFPIGGKQSNKTKKEVKQKAFEYIHL